MSWSRLIGQAHNRGSIKHKALYNGEEFKGSSVLPTHLPLPFQECFFSYKFAWVHLSVDGVTGCINDFWLQSKLKRATASRHRCKRSSSSSAENGVGRSAGAPGSSRGGSSPVPGGSNRKFHFVIDARVRHPVEALEVMSLPGTDKAR